MKRTSMLAAATGLAVALLTSQSLLGAGPAAAAAERVHWKMASAFPSSLVQLGTLGIRFEKHLALVTDGRVQLKFFEPGALVPALEIFDAVSIGSVDAGWSASGFWAGKVQTALDTAESLYKVADAVETLNRLGTQSEIEVKGLRDSLLPLQRKLSDRLDTAMNDPLVKSLESGTGRFACGTAG